MELIFNPCGEFRWSPEGPASQIHPPDLHVGAPEIFLHVWMSIQLLKREWAAESNWKLPHMFILSKTESFVHEYAVEDVLVTALSAKYLSLGRALLWWWCWEPTKINFNVTRTAYPFKHSALNGYVMSILCRECGKWLNNMKLEEECHLFTNITLQINGAACIRKLPQDTAQLINPLRTFFKYCLWNGGN